MAFCRDGLAHSSRPARSLVFDELPKTATGKLQRFRIRELTLVRLSSSPTQPPEAPHDRDRHAAARASNRRRRPARSTSTCCRRRRTGRALRRLLRRLPGLRTAIVDSLPEPGGQVTALYPEKLIYDVAGFPGIKGRDLVAGLVAQAARFDPCTCSASAPSSSPRGRAPSARRRPAAVTTDRARRITCGAVVVTGGIGTFTPRPLPGGDEWQGRGLDYFVQEPAAHAGQDVVVVGGGDSAVDWALTLEPSPSSVTLVHRREAFRAHAATVADMVRARPSSSPTPR